MLVRSLFFLGIFGALLWAWRAVGDGGLAHWWIEHGVVDPAVALIGLATPELRPSGQGARIVADGGGLRVLAGCEGTELFFLWLAAAAVTPMAWRARLVTVLLGALLAWLGNLLRILVLFYLHRGASPWFDLVHNTLGPLVLVVLMAWLFQACLVAGRGPAGAGR